jgi:hypothetical protein
LAFVSYPLGSLSYTFAQEVVIDDAYTMNYRQEPQAEFSVWRPVLYNVDYTVTGNPNKTYRVVIVVRSMGDRLKAVQKQKPGSYTTILANLAGRGDVGTYTVNYTVKLKRRGLLDVDTNTSQLSVNDVGE